MKRGGPSHPKTDELAAILGVERWGAVGILESLFHWASTYARRGDVGRHRDAAIAKGIGWEGDPAALVAALRESGWFDVCCTEHRLRIHDWPEHADQSVHRCREVLTDGFLKCYKASKKLVRNSSEASSKLDCEGLGGRHKAQGRRQTADGTGKKGGELEQLLAEPEIRSLCDVWVEKIGGTRTLGLARAVRRCLAGGYDRQVPIDAIAALAAAKAQPDRFPPKAFARWCVAHNSKPGYVLRPEKVEDLAAEFQQYGQPPRAAPSTTPRHVREESGPVDPAEIRASLERGIAAAAEPKA